MSKGRVANLAHDVDHWANDEPLDAATQERARAAIERLRDVYASEWVPAALREVEEALAMARTTRGDRHELFDRIYRVAHDMKGQGATFGYPVLSEIGASLSRLTAERIYAGEAEIAALDAHVVAARAALALGPVPTETVEARRMLASLRITVRSLLH